jgi:hypothetical protein
MSDYQLTDRNTIVRIVDGASIPSDPANRDYAEYLAWLELPGNVPLPADVPAVDLPAYVMVRRDELVDGGVTFNGVEFQTRATDRENIMGASQLALMAIINGAQPGDLRWASPDADFNWIAMDNSMVPMDAQTVIAFGQTAAARKQTLIMTARAIKDAIESGAITTTAEIDAAFG